jgi:hypothetical protein
MDVGGEFGVGVEAAEKAALAVAPVFLITTRFLAFDCSRLGRCDQKIGTSNEKGFGGFASFIVMKHKAFGQNQTFLFFYFSFI